MHIRTNFDRFAFASGKARSRIFALLLAGSALSACTTSMSVREDTATPSNAMHGIAYRLPEQSLSLEVTWAVSNCPVISADPASRDIGFETSATLTSKIVEGPSLVIDYTRMTNRFKSGSFTAEYYVNEDKSPTRIIKNINASIKGEEPAAIKSAISSATGIAKLALGLPGGKVGSNVDKKTGRDEQVESPCNAATYDARKALTELEKEIKKDTEKSSALSARIAVLQSRMVGGELTAADKIEADKIFQAIDALTASIEIRKEASKTLKSKLRYVEKFDVAIQPNTVQKFVPNETKFQKWLTTLSHEENDISKAAADKKLNRFEIVAQLSPVPDRFIDGRSAKPTQAATSAAGTRAENRFAQKSGTTTNKDIARSWPGYVYRDPSNYKVIVKSAKDDALLDQVERISQLGHLRVLPLRSRWGEHNTLTADFAPDGVPTKVVYTTPQASGVAMLEALDDAVGGALEISDLLTAKKEARKTEQEGVAAKELAQLKVEVDTLEQRKKLLELQNGPIQEVADINAELTLLRLQKERAELQAAIRNAQPKSDD